MHGEPSWEKNRTFREGLPKKIELRNLERGEKFRTFSCMNLHAFITKPKIKRGATETDRAVQT